LKDVAAGSGVIFVKGDLWDLKDLKLPLPGNKKSNIRAELFAILSAIVVTEI